MKITVKNLGILKQAEFEVGDLTIICGANNTGKTYATYALYGFLAFWNENFTFNLLENGAIEKLLANGNVKIALENITKKSNEIIVRACSEYHAHLPMIFAAPDKNFQDSRFTISLDTSEIKVAESDEQIIGFKRKPLFSITKENDEASLSISLRAKAEDVEKIDKDWINRSVNHQILGMVFGNIFTMPFIASAERTGAAIFRTELDFARNRLLEHMTNREKEINPGTLLNTYFDRGYALPVNRDVDFTRSLEDIFKNESIIARDNPEILTFFGELLGGEYKATKDVLYFVPSKSSVKLKMKESASSVRSLLNIGFYIRHIAKPGDILMIDEPELNLHPANQRRMARFLARLVNVGVRVFITTHSDYILKEFNTLIMLKSGGVTAERVMKEQGYCKQELLDVSKIKAYVAGVASIRFDGASRKGNYNTFVPAPIDEHGIEIDSFDDTINLMNEIQEELIFGEL